MHRSRAATAVAALVVAAASAAPAFAVPARVAPTSTTVAISVPQSSYGQPVTATATVVADPGPAQGDVVFSVDGLAYKANLGASGTASVVLPAAAVGQHAVSATFVPQLPQSQQGSTSPAQPWVVVPVRTRLQVRVIGRGARIPTSVQVRAAGDYGTRPTGRVTLVVRRLGTRGSTRVAERLDGSAVALAGLGRLAKGRYRMAVTYVGDSQHLREAVAEKFCVRRR